VVRLNTDGSRDAGFGDGGQKVIDLSDPDAGTDRSTVLHAVRVQADGSIVVAGRADVLVNGTPTPAAVIARLTPAGALDLGFGTAGRTIPGPGNPITTLLGLTEQPDGRLVAIGYTGNFSMAFERFDHDGHTDNSFHNSGFITVGAAVATNGGAAVALQPNGGVIGTSGTSDGVDGSTYLVRLNGAFGSLDTDFGRDGIKTIDLVTSGADFTTALAVQPDGRFVVAGSAEVSGKLNAFVARFSSDGLLDRGFGDSGVAVPRSGIDATRFQAIALDTDGRILVAGYRTSSPQQLLLYRLWP
jgi:uncharacterized delta-60 repeat protein